MVMLANQPPHKSASLEPVSSFVFQVSSKPREVSMVCSKLETGNPKLLFRIAIPVPAHEAREELNTSISCQLSVISFQPNLFATRH